MKKQKPNFFKDAWYGRLPPVSVLLVSLTFAIIVEITVGITGIFGGILLKSGLDSHVIHSFTPILPAVTYYMLLVVPQLIFFVWSIVSLWRSSINCDVPFMQALGLLFAVLPIILITAVTINNALSMPSELLVYLGQVILFIAIKALLEKFFKDSNIEIARDSINTIKAYS